MNFYRYEHNRVDDSRVIIYFLEFILIKETKKGYWIKTRSISQPKKWVSKTAKKRFAYPTKKEALESFEARKRRQIVLLDWQKGGAYKALNEIRKLKIKEGIE